MIRPTVGCLILIALAGAGPAQAQLIHIPSPWMSEVDACVVATYGGSRTLHVVVRDFGMNVIPGSLVQVDLANCATAAFCSPPCTSCSAGPNDVRRLTDAAGAADFDLRIAGVCASAQVRIFADGILLATRALATPDQDGSGAVNAQDVVIVHAKLGTTDPTADFDCNGMVDAADESFAQGWVSSYCNAPVPARSRTWGELKVRYR